MGAKKSKREWKRECEVSVCACRCVCVYARACETLRRRGAEGQSSERDGAAFCTSPSTCLERPFAAASALFVAHKKIL